MTAVSVFAPAKLNLYLHVTGRRANGYHELDSLVAFAAVGDTVTARPADTLTLAVDGPMAPLLADAGDDNLVLQAARALAAEAGVGTGAALTLTKRLPVASGIGGGSADAAATLKALAELWRLSLPAERMQALALGLGADVPVCLAGTPARMAGIGERLSPVPPLPAAWVALANPMKGLSTPAVFKARRGCFSDPAPLEAAPRDARHLAELLAARRNDLEKAAASLVPEISNTLDLLAAQPGCLLARMSGSGATCFALFAAQPEAEKAAAALTTARPGWWCAAAGVMPG
ncbi:4-(cytidine 5'-diphospho)-2-C-methyl-D-erythritol kinase [Magnetospirillum sp. UT-4]|uniref:4-(cytidine 5'-diphospho)-2-C-methyl-D-erythritol kinase n=1 Tax=Magnetospirillum sp. UT-4 TaxID=2681467 RepID=UPI00137DAD7E|nr:4-(cytidine 5'-diphospho)-2-C-methyl-D-erythritol kinase [Magnetospirillum sp. UT-4]CAA7621390.1 4-diphosphocytidyl-2-C-methyl-D-erythritol kinase [Magnetospirillum sp. UT-4]